MLEKQHDGTAFPYSPLSQATVSAYGCMLMSACGGEGGSETPTNTPVFSSDVSINVLENTVVTGYTATDADGDTFTFSVSGGADQSTFSIDETTGVLSFLTAHDYDAPSDSDNNNCHVI